MFQFSVFRCFDISRLRVLEHFHGDNRALSADDANGLTYGDILLADGFPHVTVYLHVARSAGTDRLCHLTRTSQQRVGIAWFVRVVLVQVTQCYWSDEQDAQQREDGKDEYLPVDAQAAHFRNNSKDGTDGEADDEKIT